MNITLSVKDRVLLNAILPTKGERIEMILVADLKSQIEFTLAEIDEYELKDLPGGGLSGNPKKIQDKSLSISVAQAALLKELPLKLNKEKNITVDMLPLLDKIDLL